ncbi:hypothetical protein QJS66_13145 [Kocuria rhizophila]|nr:hypothetical protein QJS66_13145 [Kocuria rhizophila]
MLDGLRDAGQRRALRVRQRRLRVRPARSAGKPWPTCRRPSSPATAGRPLRHGVRGRPAPRTSSRSRARSRVYAAGVVLRRLIRNRQDAGTTVVADLSGAPALAAVDARVDVLKMAAGGTPGPGPRLGRRPSPFVDAGRALVDEARAPSSSRVPRTSAARGEGAPCGGLGAVPSRAAGPPRGGGLR